MGLDGTLCLTDELLQSTKVSSKVFVHTAAMAALQHRHHSTQHHKDVPVPAGQLSTG
jgi:hypothetical protein